MSKEQVKAVCDYSHDVIVKLKKMFGIKKKESSLLCHSLAHLNSATWLERISSNGILSEYIVRR
jgi:hypothetical protein